MIHIIHERHSLIPFMSNDDPTLSTVSNGNSQRINDAAVGRLLCFMKKERWTEIQVLHDQTFTI